eukprot:TRINITY_DN71473_c0_g1_i1.p1 TRINITY_DN71473_c0_g1~~TRINITY_DN71473_c0_g1_i1.p1  ORF type:complete len:248 (+),score=33.27 TRINITY_DN71473_c0_g1_i1:28-744(+)
METEEPPPEAPAAEGESTSYDKQIKQLKKELEAEKKLLEAEKDIPEKLEKVKHEVHKLGAQLAYIEHDRPRTDRQDPVVNDPYLLFILRKQNREIQRLKDEIVAQRAPFAHLTYSVLPSPTALKLAQKMSDLTKENAQLKEQVSEKSAGSLFVLLGELQGHVESLKAELHLAEAERGLLGKTVFSKLKAQQVEIQRRLTELGVEPNSAISLPTGESEAAQDDPASPNSKAPATKKRKT